MTQLILTAVLLLITALELSILVDEWRTTRNPGGAMLGLAFIVFTDGVIGTAIWSIK